MTSSDPQTAPARIAVVTGGTAGLGRATVRALTADGWDVAVLARGADGLAGTLVEIEASGRRGLAIAADVADGAAVEAAADRIEDELGPIDLWVNNAMAGVFGTFLDTDPDDFRRATDVTYFGVVNGTRAALSRMVPRDRGHVIQIGSALAHRGIPLQSGYCGAKHAIKGFTESVVAELTHEGSAVAVSMVDMPALNTIQFSWVKSKLDAHPQPVPTIFEPEAGARAVVAVANTPRRRTWVGEPTVMTVLGNKFLPRFMDWYLSKAAWDGQFAPDKNGPRLPDNLYAPSPGDQGARGAFSDRAKEDSVQLWGIRNRRLVAGAGAALGTGAAALAVGLLRRR